MFPFLQSVIVSIGTYQVTTYRLLQHGGTAAGLTILIITYLVWLARRRNEAEVEADATGGNPPDLAPWFRASAWIGLTILPLAVGLLLGCSAAGERIGVEFVRSFVVHAVIGFSAVAGGLLIGIGGLLGCCEGALTQKRP